AHRFIGGILKIMKPQSVKRTAEPQRFSYITTPWIGTAGAWLCLREEGEAQKANENEVHYSCTIGLFFGNDQHNSILVLVEFRWDKTNPETPTWQQSFSADNGNTWEVNWYMYFSRSGELS